MIEKIYIVTDLGPGDGGKGGVVHWIATMQGAHTIIKVGGAQGSHGVFTSKGERFAFSQWGCGTLGGIKTHISSRLVVSPEGLLNEADELRYGYGIYNPFSLLTVDESALCATPYHGISSRLKEMALGNNPRGTIGTGVGEAYRYLQRYPELAIRVGDLARPGLRDILAAVRAQIQRDLAPFIQGHFLSDDRKAVEEEASLLYDDGFLDYIVQRFQEVAKRAKIVDPGHLGREILSKDGVAVVESSHGVLTDHYYGFHPHTSAIRTLPCFTEAMLKAAGFTGKIVNIGVHRAYEIRHGAGPMPTADPTMTEILLPGSSKQENRYQGKVRVGPLDLNLLRYAIEVCRGSTTFDGLALTWFDQVMVNGVWHLCNSYQGANNPQFFSPSGEITIHHGDDEAQLKHQEKIGQQLLCCVPEVTDYHLPKGADSEKLFDFIADLLRERLSIPVRMVSFGPTELDKVCR